jgi:hypothetical protein
MTPAGVRCLLPSRAPFYSVQRRRKGRGIRVWGQARARRRRTLRGARVAGPKQLRGFASEVPPCERLLSRISYRYRVSLPSACVLSRVMGSIRARPPLTCSRSGRGENAKSGRKLCISSKLPNHGGEPAPSTKGKVLEQYGFDVDLTRPVENTSDRSRVEGSGMEFEASLHPTVQVSAQRHRRMQSCPFCGQIAQLWQRESPGPARRRHRRGRCAGNTVSTWTNATCREYPRARSRRRWWH